MPKIEKKSGRKTGKKSSVNKEGTGSGSAEAEVKSDIKPTPLGPLGSRKASAQSAANNDQPAGLESLAEAAKEE